MPQLTSPQFFSHSGVSSPNSYSSVKSLAIRADGSIVGSTGAGVAFFNADGSPDMQHSAWRPPVVSSNILISGEDFKLMPDGSVIIAGTYLLGSQNGYAVFKVKANGNIDPDFGDGQGWGGSAVGGSRLLGEMAVGRDGKIVVVGTDFGTTGTSTHLTLNRFTADGKADATFGTNGSVELTAGHTRGHGLALQADGKIIIAGTLEIDGLDHAAVYRFNTDGTLDKSFGGLGAIAIDHPSSYAYQSYSNAVALQADGKIVVVGAAPSFNPYVMQNQYAITRFNADGTLDRTFGSGGKVTYFVAPDQGTWIPGGNGFAGANATSVVIRDDGSIIVGGTISRWADSSGNGQFGLLALRSDGSIDKSFGHSGIVTADLGPDTSVMSYDIEEAPDGRLIIAGDKGSTKGGGVTYAMASFNADGSADTSFGSATSASQNSITYREGHGATVLNADLSIKIASIANNGYQGTSLNLVRHGGANSADHFSGSGSLTIANGKAIVDGMAIGTVATGNGSLRIDFNADATATLVNKTLESLSYRNSADLAANENIVIDWTFTEGSSSAQTSTQIKLAATAAPAWIDEILSAAAASGNPAGYLGLDHSLGITYNATASAGHFDTGDKADISALLAKLSAIADLKFTPATAAGSGTLSILSAAELEPGYTSYTELAANGANIALGLPGTGGLDPLMPLLQQRILQVLGVQLDTQPGELTDIQIAALQFLYGPNKTARSADDTYTLSQSQSNFLWDGKGKDTISAAEISSDVTLHLDPGYWDYIGSKGNSISAAGQITVNYGSAFENAIGGAGHDHIFGTASSNILRGGAGNDTLAGQGGSDLLDGGSGVDTASYSGKRADFTIIRSGSTATVSGASGKDLLTSVERLHFADADVAIDIDGNAGQLYRLYQAIFNRKPDLAGLGWWLDAVDRGVSLESVAESFTQSREFTQMYGANAGNTVLLTKIYEYALHRVPDKEGFAWWLDVLDSHQASLGSVLMGFSESQENYAQVIGSILNGIAYTPFQG